MSKAMRGSERAARVGAQGRGTRVPVLRPDRRPPPSSGTALLSHRLQAREPQPPRCDPVLSSLLLSCVFASLLDIYTALFKPSTTLWESWAQKPLCFWGAHSAPLSSPDFQQQVQTGADHGREGQKEEARGSQETMVQPADRSCFLLRGHTEQYL